MNENAEAVAALVARLPEIYQPIYGYAEFSSGASRATEDRLDDIKRIYERVSEKFGRPLRVLDLGCAQGFMSLSLASMGASVVGVDMLPENIELCRRLGAINSKLDVNFVEARIEDFVSSLDKGHFDLVLLLSVIHHVAFHVSPNTAASTVERLRSISPVLLAELALADEPLYWASALPRNPLDTFGSAAFVREVRQTGTHLSEVKRPLYFVSDELWYAMGQIGTIESFRRGGHRFAKASFKSSRTYYMSADRVLKKLALLGEDADINRRETDREVEFLNNMADSDDYPRVIGVENDGQYSYLLREKIRGELLADLIDSGGSFDYYIAIRDVLRECISLESKSLYHQDIRVWNVLRREDGKFCLIDYGAISSSKNDCFWPQNIYISFLVFVKELVSAPLILAEPIRAVSVTPYGFPGHLSYWIASLSKVPLQSWSFELMLAELEQSFLDPGAAAVEPDSAREALLQMLEEAVTELARSDGRLAATIDADREVTRESIGVEKERISNLHHDMHGLRREQGALAEKVEERLSAISIFHQNLEQQRLLGLEVLQKLESVSYRLDAMDANIRKLDTVILENLERIVALNGELVRDVSEIKSRVSRGFLKRLFLR